MRPAQLALLAAALLAAPAAGATTIAVTLTDTQIQLPQAPVRVGTVVFRVANHARGARDFRVAGRRTPRIAPGRSATLTVPIAKTGLVLLTSAGPPGSATLRGVHRTPPSNELVIPGRSAPVTR